MPTLLWRGWFPAQGGHCAPGPHAVCLWGEQAGQGVPQLLPPVSPSLSQFTADLHRHPEILNISDGDVLHSFLNGSFSLPNASVLLQQLDAIDNAACGWVHFMAKVRLCLPATHCPQAGFVGLKEGVRSLQISLRPWNGSSRGDFCILG